MEGTSIIMHSFKDLVESETKSELKPITLTVNNRYRENASDSSVSHCGDIEFDQ